MVYFKVVLVGSRVCGHEALRQKRRPPRERVSTFVFTGPKARSEALTLSRALQDCRLVSWSDGDLIELNRLTGLAA